MADDTKKEPKSDKAAPDAEAAPTISPKAQMPIALDPDHLLSKAILSALPVDFRLFRY
jgi:hypothetical protein